MSCEACGIIGHSAEDCEEEFCGECYEHVDDCECESMHGWMSAVEFVQVRRRVEADYQDGLADVTCAAPATGRERGDGE